MKLTEIERCRKIAEARFGVSPAVTVRWALRGLTAGYCKYITGGASEINLNAKIAGAEGDKFVSTIAHEFAHAVVWAIQHTQGLRRVTDHHGPLWQQVMNAFGYPAQRCHSYESAEAVRHIEKFKYRCGCKAVQLVGPKIHAKIQRGSIYTCRVCRRKLVAEAERSADQLMAMILGGGDE
jgi:predicted SprT family Zn-dependent metalloprotease